MKTLATTRQRVLYRAREIWQSDFRTFDTETTGLGPEDEIIQWAVCDQHGSVLGSGYIKPTVPISDGAYALHGISIEQLTSAPTFDQVWESILKLLTEKTVVGYNTEFDLSRLWASANPYGIEIPYMEISTICAMHLFAEFYGEYHEYHGTYTWQKLNEVAIPYLKLEVAGSGHDAIHDARATGMIIKKLAEMADEELPAGWHPPVDVPCAGGCGYTRECAESDEIWYCHPCGTKAGVYHQCSACTGTVKTPATGYISEDLCNYCHQRLHREYMLLTGQWHWCPSHWHPLVVETSDLDELCADCLRQQEWKRRHEETERLRQERIEQERKEHRRAYAREYRQRKKEEARINAERVAQGLQPLEKPDKPDPDAIFMHHGHQFQRQKDEDGRQEVYCLICTGIWSRPPVASCNGMKTYWAWSIVPDHLKTRTQLRKLKLKPTEGHVAIMQTSYDGYYLYDQNKSVPTGRKQKIEA